jgi:hypothetical protein
MEKRKLASKLDWGRMLGFEQIIEVRESASLGPKVGTKTGQKVGNKVGGKVGHKVGLKLGAKQGVKVS